MNRPLLAILTLAFVFVGSALAQSPQFAELPITDVIPNLPDSTALCAADFDGDGIEDLILGAVGQDRLFLGDGRGGFREATAGRMPFNNSGPLGMFPRLLHVLDVDGDGDQDFLGSAFVQSWGCLFGFTDGLLTLYINDGTGRFADGVALQSGFLGGTTSVASGDVDGDGDLDLLVGMRGTFWDTPGQLFPVQNLLLINDGMGSFADEAASRLPLAADVTQGVALADADGDGDLDAVIGSVPHPQSALSGASLFVNDGAGRFTDVTAARLPTGAQGAVAAVDVEGDGDVDLVFGQSITHRGRLLLNDGAGRFSDVTAGRLPSAAIDFDTDGSGERITPVDVDADGDQDLVFGSSLFRNDGNGRFTDDRLEAGGFGAVAVVDADRDGYPELVFRNGLRFANGGGVLARGRLDALPGRISFGNDIAVGDVDGDGDADLVLADQPFRILLQGAKGAFHDADEGGQQYVSGGAGSIELADFDADGDLDLVVGALSSGQLNLYLNDGRGSFTDVSSRMPSPSSYYFTDLATADVDGDGDVDVVACTRPLGSSLGENILLLNDGLGNFVDATSTQMPALGEYTLGVAVLDVDGDGDADFVFANSGTDRLYLNDGLGVFTEAPQGHLPVGPHASYCVAGADVDGDGDLDLVMGTEGGNRVYLGDGSGQFTDVSMNHLPAGLALAESIACGDLDDDGDPDLLLGIPNDCAGSPGNLLALANDGAGRFQDATGSILPAFQDQDVRAVALADLDQDGDLDLITGNARRFCGGGGCDHPEPGPSHVFFNRLAHLRAPVLPHLGNGYDLEIHALADTPSTLLFALPFLSSGTSHTPIPGLGTLRLDPQALLPLPVVQIPQPAGVVTTTVPVPNDLSLVGAEVFGQSLLVGWANRSRLTNPVRDRILR